MHLMTETADAVQELVKAAADLNPTFMETADKAAALLTWLEVENQVAELRLRVMACAGDVAEAEGFRSVATWLAHHGRVRRADAAADLRLAEALDRTLPTLARSLREGRVTLAQAHVVARAVSEIPDSVGADVIARAEAELVRLAEDHDPSELATLGRRILEVVDPDRFEEVERRRLEDAERNARERQRLRIRSLGDGTARISGVVPDAVAARLTTYLHAFTNPRLRDGTARPEMADDSTSTHGFGSPTSHPRRLAEAFGQLLETLDPRRLPIHGGDATTLTVTVSLETLRSGLGSAAIDNGADGDGFDALSAGEARRLACTARIIPAVLGKKSEVLDLGRAARLFSPAQRRAMALRDSTCRAEGCSIPASWCEAHHLTPWSRGGRTDVDDGVLLCSHHHHRVHDPEYGHHRLPTGRLRFHRLRSRP